MSPDCRDGLSFVVTPFLLHLNRDAVYRILKAEGLALCRRPHYRKRRSSASCMWTTSTCRSRRPSTASIADVGIFRRIGRLLRSTRRWLIRALRSTRLKRRSFLSRASIQRSIENAAFELGLVLRPFWTGR